MNLNDVQTLTEMHLEAHGLLAKGWFFKFSRASTTFGTSNSRLKRIKVSKATAAINTEERVERLILHEIAHALTPNDPGHGREWRAKCEEIGLPNEPRCWSEKDTVQVPRRWTMTCPKCGANWHRDKQTRNRYTKAARQYSCPKDKATLLVWRTSDGPPALLTRAIAANRKETA